ncbi:hypothetical protein [Aneurinibacillus thermoaerophilus]|uniref:Uncharacterized protein n=1 Tax=Aneurinibacillus thermoaerophilus TaxID=143495 RepID=A0A1G7WSN0_ANETH|nr:hypothetical protein [Aneurinibacillus thermoaerophilus]MED0678166.1 hypothetical protein [Aneurinibacillus thermoaerophilus]MED0737648.1 hypothetical protein [Aneurinibacillus thermoaerophilus]MED0755640.1 hypothetical protein [Aneurinibacillus thermoaerophilus]MED0760031.1 hypothetical protein [Aneurinibacillus thermoaerophilus]MED0765645.1 hypothetical protein [Aneurinibacillus thermoaerophilus]
MVISRREMARAKVEKLKKGFSAFSETQEITELMERYIKEEKLNVHVDKTSLGCWFIPADGTEHETRPHS